MLNDLLQRADRALAENKTLVEELQKSVRRARELDDNLQYLHWLRIEDERRQRVCTELKVRPRLPISRDVCSYRRCW